VSALDFKSLKKDFRNSVLKKTLGLVQSDVQNFSQSISQSIVQFLTNQLFVSELTQKKIWAAFLPLKSEPQIDFKAIQETFSDKIEFVFPQVEGQNLAFFSQVNQWKMSSLGVQEPANGQKVSLNTISGFFIPAVAFHTQGYRLGRGLGFYDRALESFHGLKIGVSYQNNILNDVPFEDHDICMDYIITNKQILKIQKNIEIGDI